jgi:hypothetical protein
VLAFSSTLLEYFGKQIIIKHFEKTKQKIINEEILHLSFNTVAIILYSNSIITKDLFDDINYVKNKRNEIIHKGNYFNFNTIGNTNVNLIGISRLKIKEIENIANKSIHSTSAILNIYINYDKSNRKDS